MILLDTHVLVWLAEDNPALGHKAIWLTDRALHRNELAVAAISFWEIAMLVRKSRLQLRDAPTTFRRLVLEHGVRELAIDGAVAIGAAEPEGRHGDPADRMIVATALHNGATLLTADEQLLRWGKPLTTCDARR